MMFRLKEHATTIRICLLLFCFFTVATRINASERVRYVVLVDDGAVAGEQTVEHGDDGVTRVHFVYKHSLSHNELDEEYRLGSDRTYTEYHVKGISEYCTTVDEQFT